MDNQTPPTEEKKLTPDHSDWRWRRHRPWGIGLLCLGIIFGLIFFAVGSMSWHRRALFNRENSFASSGVLSGDRNHSSNLGMMKHEFRRPTIGTISKIDGNTLTVHTISQDYSVIVSATTSIYKAGMIAKQSDLTTGVTVIVRGAPNSSGQILASSLELL